MSLIELKAKLLRTEDWRAINGAAVVKRYHNPDGPEAVAQLEAMQAEIDRLNERLVETQMRAFKWMEAHDKLYGGKPYKFPSPADVPAALAELERLRGELVAIRVAAMNGEDDACEAIMVATERALYRPALAGEAGTAETTQIGSAEGEHATAKPERPNTTTPQGR